MVVPEAFFKIRWHYFKGLFLSTRLMHFMQCWFHAFLHNIRTLWVYLDVFEAFNSQSEYKHLTWYKAHVAFLHIRHEIWPLCRSRTIVWKVGMSVSMVDLGAVNVAVVGSCRYFCPGGRKVSENPEKIERWMCSIQLTHFTSCSYKWCLLFWELCASYY